MKFQAKENYTISDLVAIMALLRGEGGCPWDREQDHLSIRKNLIEEAYEVVEAIDDANPDMLCEELGDLLLQVVFHSRISEEAGEFSIDEVADGICKKLIHRHPHIFADVLVRNSDEVLENWDAIKREEKGQTSASQTLHSVPKVLPALMRSQKVRMRAAKSGFDFPDALSALSNLESEVAELREAIEAGAKKACYDELGDVLFSAANVARHLSIDAEEALTGSCEKFIRRFDRMEELAATKGIVLEDESLDRLNAFWDAAKRSEV